METDGAVSLEPEVARSPRAASRAARAALAALTLETPLLTAVYWGTVVLYVAAFWLPKFPPLVDYPQHLAVAALLRRWLDPSSPERHIYDVNLATYNGAFHLLTALVGLVMPIEAAGRVVLSLMPPALAVGAIALMRAAKRPRYYALLLLPLTMNGMVSWGFINNVLAYGVGFVAFAWIYRAIHGERALFARGAVLGVLVAALHIFGEFVLCASAGLVATGKLAFGKEPLRERLQMFASTCAALLPGALLSGFFVLHNRASSYSNWENAIHDGTDEFAWRKVAFFADFLIGNFPDHTDRRLFYVLLALVAYLFWPRERESVRGDRALLWLAAFFGLLYLVTPRVLFATWFIFERIPYLIVAFVVAGAPAVTGEASRWVKIFAALLGIATALNVDVHHARIPEEDDASAILDAIPPGKRVVGLIWGPTAWPVIERATWVHFQAYYVVRHPGEMTPSFTFIESLPVHYKDSARPPRQVASAEWSPENYAPSEPYARYFDTVLVLAPRDSTDPVELVFQGDAPRAKLIAHHGRFWAYDASEIVKGSAP